ncbi:MAG: MerR family transcriptional regulator [Acidobacteria bacterium]|nr:MerR family transcriptional regulator [Acidobacteriota bacterium]
MYNRGVAREPKGVKIGEVCRIADVQPYVLRHWESEFEQLAPKKTGGGQRLYSQDEVAIILRIKELLYGEGFTIPGAKKKLAAEVRGGKLLEEAEPAPPSDEASKLLRETRNELKALLRILDR